MNRFITYGSVAGALGLIGVLFFVASPNAREVTIQSAETFSVSKENQSGPMKSELDALSKKAQVNEEAPELVAEDRIDLANLAASDVSQSYDLKNSALSVSEAGFESAPPVIVADVNDRWLNIDNGYLDRHQHWHQADGVDVTFENFTNVLYFFPADEKFSNVTAVCKNRQNYSEILLYSDGKKWLDLNQGGAELYSVTLWDWYDSVAIKSGSQTFIEHRNPKLARWNAPIAGELAEEILRTGTFDIFVEPNQRRHNGIVMSKDEKIFSKVHPAVNLKATVTIQNIDEVRGCFDVKKPSAKDLSWQA
jgi:hypothetical protein